jgi:uncharacterized protein (DUF488 family)
MIRTAKLYTFGYEGMSLDAFIARLKQVGVDTVIDVRELPLSRKRGFSKTAFAAALHAAGIAYAHMPALGCPKPIRDAYRADGDWSSYARKFSACLVGQGPAVAEVVKIARATTVCLVCFEADFAHCHRSMVARAAALAGGPAVVHLTPKTAIPEVPVMAAA